MADLKAARDQKKKEKEKSGKKRKQPIEMEPDNEDRVETKAPAKRRWILSSVVV